MTDGFLYLVLFAKGNPLMKCLAKVQELIMALQNFIVNEAK